MIRDGCLDNLLETTQISDSLEGNAAESVSFQFNGFTFGDGSSVFLQCSIALCALDSYGDYVQPGCGVIFGGDSCAAFSEGSKMGYSIGNAQWAVESKK